MWTAIDLGILGGYLDIYSKHKTFVQRRPNVFDVGPTLYKCMFLLGYDPKTFILV